MVKNGNLKVGLQMKEILTYKRVDTGRGITASKTADILMVIIGFLAGRVELWGMVMPTGVSWALANYSGAKKKNLPVAILCSALGMVLSGIDIFKLRGIITLALIYAINKSGINLWEDKILPAAIFGATVNFICGSIIFTVMKASGFDYIMLVIEAVIIVATTISLKNVSEIVKRGGNILGDDEAISLYVALGVIVAGLDKINVAGVKMSILLSLYTVIFSAKKAGIGISVTVAAVLGVVSGGDDVVAVLGLYIFCAICCSIFSGVGNWGIIVGIGVANAVFTFCSLGQSREYLGEIICSAVLFYFTPAWFIDKVVKYTSAPHQNYYGYSRLAHQKAETDAAIGQIEEAVTTVASTIRAMNCEENEKEGDIVDKIKDGVCEKCTLKMSCKNKKNRDKIIGEIIEEAIETGSCSTKKIEQNCIHSEEMVKRALDVAEFYRKSSIRLKKQFKKMEYAVDFAQDIAEIISRRRKMLNIGYLSYETYGEEITDELVRNGVKCYGISVVKNQAGLFEVIAEIDGEFISRGECIIKEIMKLDMKTVREEKTKKGTLLHLKEKEYFKYEVAVMSLDRVNNSSGDKGIWFDDGRGYLHCFIADGMGTGSVAAKESEWTSELFEKLIKAGGEPQEVVSLINKVFIAGKKNESCLSADAVKINLHSGNVEFVKAGAPSSYVKTNKGAEKIGWSSMPLGILEFCNTESKNYNLSDGGYVVLMSDGVADSGGDRMEGEHILRRALENIDETEPREVAEQLMFASMSMGAPKDDMTVVVAKIIKT